MDIVSDMLSPERPLKPSKPTNSDWGGDRPEGALRRHLIPTKFSIFSFYTKIASCLSRRFNACGAGIQNVASIRSYQPYEAPLPEDCCGQESCRSTNRLEVLRVYTSVKILRAQRHGQQPVRSLRYRRNRPPSILAA
jgi:hypothetical protein